MIKVAMKTEAVADLLSNCDVHLNVMDYQKISRILGYKTQNSWVSTFQLVFFFLYSYHFVDL